MAGRRHTRLQRGAALLIFLVLLVTAAMTYVVNHLTPELVEALRAQKTNAALVQARDALLGYALAHREREAAVDADAVGDNDRAMYGFLPLPDLGETFSRNADLIPPPPCVGEGCTAANQNWITGNGMIVGRIPWRTLGTELLRDGHAECLWYAVSATHRGINATATVMNWDTLAAPDIAIGSGKPDLSTVSAHDRPVAVIFSPGPGFDGGRTPSADAPLCGGNYDPAHYIDTALANAQIAQPITSAMLFGAIRKHGYFRQDINTLLDRVVGCLRDEIAAGGSVTNGKITGDDLNACYGRDVSPRGYYPNYREMIYVAAPATVNGTSCAGAVLFAGQRDSPRQVRADINPTTDSNLKNDPSNYLDGNNAPATFSIPVDHLSHYNNNLTHYLDGTNIFSGPENLGEVHASVTNKNDFLRCASGGVWSSSDECQTAEQDIVRCIPTGASLNQVISPALNALGGQLTAYDAANRTLTLGRVFSITAAQRNANRFAMFGCSWVPEVHLMGSGLRSYFKFNIANSGEGFTFAIIDGERNDANVCGAARQHLGYSGSNGITTSIAAPKIGIEIDTTRQGTFNPALLNTLANGRNDPNYLGGHAGIVYWGGETAIATGSACTAACTSPRICSAGQCVLPPAEDDNVHGLPTPPDPSLRPVPRNPPVPAVVTQDGAGIARLDSSSVASLVGVNIHVRVEVQLLARDDVARTKTYQIDVWLEKGDTSTNIIAAMQNTTRPLALLYPGIDAATFLHLRDTPTIYDIQGGSCAGGTSCPIGQTCSTSDNMCYAEAFHTARIGFTTSQSTVANDQIINITDFFTSWVP